MVLYHGSPTGGITALRPALSNHGKPYVYLTHSEPLALLYAHNPLPPPQGWFPYFWRDGVLHYDEYFPGALTEIYGGQSGWVYTCEGEWPALEKMPWVYLSEEVVPVAAARHVPDLLAALLERERMGELVIHRYEDIPESQREVDRRVVARSAEGLASGDPSVREYLDFIRTHMPGVLE